MKTGLLSTWVLGALGAVLSLALTGVAFPVAAHAAGAATSVKVGEKNVAAGATETVHGRVAHGPRKVRIQLRPSGGHWRKAASTRSKASGRFSASFRAPSRAGRFEVRVLAPRAKIKGKSQPAVVSHLVRFNVQPVRAPVAVLPMESEVLSLVNQERTKAGCAPVAYEWHLHLAARGHSVEMAKSGVLAHESPDGRTPSDRITAAGYHWTAWGENVAAHQPTAAQVMHDWMNSPPHKANILNCVFTELGVGLAFDGAGHPYWTQDFGDR
ncbi:MAG TPA: CAP domain-containing protein [Nocardioides sp.]|nr:CAP domain-containing protein [Nocardioides sp.]